MKSQTQGRKGGGKGKKPLKPKKAKSTKCPALRILILEDNPADAELMTRQLKKDGMGFSARRADARSDFLEGMKAFKPDIILADYSLPGFNALQALALRNKISPATPFIVVTGTISEEVAVRCMKQGADDYLLKDRLARLGEAVRHALEKRRLREEKARTEATLRENELLYRTFIDHSTDLAFLKDDGFRHLLANPALCRFFGKPENEVLGKTDFELMDRRAAAGCRRSDKQAYAANKIQVSEETIGGRTFETRKFPVPLTDGRIGLGGYIRDISKRKQAEDALKESEERYRDLVENSQDLIYTHDLEGKLLSANQMTVQLLGYSMVDLLGMNITELLVPEVRHLFNAYLTELRTSGRASGRMRIRTAYGENRYWEYNNTLRTQGLPFPIVRGMARDITDRDRAEKALQEMNEIFRLFLKHSPIYVFIKDENIRPVYLSENYEELLKRPLAEILGKKMDEIFPSALSLAMIEDDKRILREGVPLEFIEELNGRIYATIKFPIFIAGKAKYLAGYTIDITERKHAEEQIRDSLREKEILLKEIHHRVKNNLQVISGLLSLQAAQTNDELLQRWVKQSQARIWTMALIHQTLYQSGNLADIDMADYIRSLVGNLLSSHAPAAMPPTIRFDLCSLRLGIDQAIPLGLITNELVTNVMKHAFADGRPGEIRIRLQECRGAALHAPSASMDATPIASTACRVPTHELTIADNGMGLPAGFDLKNQKSLGLQLVAMLAQQLECRLAIESSGGTAVHLRFTHNEKSKKQS